jgi:hypothetical protein
MNSPGGTLDPIKSSLEIDYPKTHHSPLGNRTKFKEIGRGVSVEILEEGRKFLGLGQVVVNGTKLRSTARPILPELRSPDAIHFEISHIEGEIEELEDGGIRLHLALSQHEGGNMEWMLHTVRPRYRRSDWNQPPQLAKDTSLIWEIRPVKRTINSETAIGLSYQYFYSSASVPIYKILDRSTWEPGGRAIGNVFWLRNAFTSPVKSFESIEDSYSTEWYLPSATNPNIFEFLPLQTGLSGFTMTANARGSLITWVPKVAHVRSLFEKPRGHDQIVHLHELCGDLSLNFTTSPMEVLWFAGKRDRVQQINFYEAVRSFVSETLHAQVGMRVERASSYGVIEEWGNPDLRHYADKGLPKLIESGVQTVFLPNQFENNMNTFGAFNMCCTTDLRVAESVGEDNLSYFCKKAKEAEVTVEMWGNTAMSTLAWTVHNRNGRENRVRLDDSRKTVFHELAAATDPWVRNASNALEADHYSPYFMAMNLRDETVRRIWLDRWHDARERLGLGGIFLDSSYNMSSDKFHWIARPNATRHGGTSDQTELLGYARPEIEPMGHILSQFMAHLTLMAEMQKMGYVYCGEDHGVFGIHRAGASSSFMIDCLSLWVDCLPDFDPVEIAKLGADPDDIYFQGLAYRSVWKLQWDPASDRITWIIGKSQDSAYTPKPEQIAALKCYAQVSPYMSKRTVLPNERGVVYQSNGKTVLWAFESFTANIDGSPVTIHNLLKGNSTQGQNFIAAKRDIYLIDSERIIS